MTLRLFRLYRFLHDRQPSLCLPLQQPLLAVLLCGLRMVELPGYDFLEEDFGHDGGF